MSRFASPLPMPCVSAPPNAPRYNPVTGELKISCQRFPSREENRRWCLEVLLRLLQEGHRVAPSGAFLLDRVVNPFEEAQGGAGAVAARVAAAASGTP